MMPNRAKNYEWGCSEPPVCADMTASVTVASKMGSIGGDSDIVVARGVMCHGVFKAGSGRRADVSESLFHCPVRALCSVTYLVFFYSD